MVPTVLGAGILIFFLMRVIPGDICLSRWVDYGLNLDPTLLELCRNELGLNDPLYVQFLHFVQGVLTFDFGDSLWTGQPVIEEIRLRSGLSLQVAIMATGVAILIAFPLGIVAAVKQNTWVDYLVRCISIAGTAVPSFWLGILILLGLLIFSQAWFGEPWMPPIESVSPFDDLRTNLAVERPVLETRLSAQLAGVHARRANAAFV